MTFKEKQKTHLFRHVPRFTPISSSPRATGPPASLLNMASWTWSRPRKPPGPRAHELPIFKQKPQVGFCCFKGRFEDSLWKCSNVQMFFKKTLKINLSHTQPKLYFFFPENDQTHRQETWSIPNFWPQRDEFLLRWWVSGNRKWFFCSFGHS